jgi:hypothetical protein
VVFGTKITYKRRVKMDKEREDHTAEECVRKPYTTPELTVYGDVATVTERSTLNVHRDNPTHNS